ncbi:unnamed protein product [Alternaria sp. RS040]
MVPTGSDEGRGIATTTRGGFILVSTYAWAIVTAGVLVARFWQSRSQKVEAGLDDVAIIAATIVYLGATVGWQYTIRGGLGKDVKDLSDENISLFFKVDRSVANCSSILISDYRHPTLQGYSNGGLSIAVIGLNMTTDLFLAFWMIPVLWKLSLDKEKSFAAATLFGVRAIVAFVAGGEIWATLRLASSQNPTRDAVELIVLTQ